MPIRFRLLGDVGVDINDVPVEIGHARQRCVLAVLLVEANRTVSTDRLIDRVWGEHPPQRAREALYSYLSRLRNSIAGAAGVGITRRSVGYLLTTDPATVDLHLFRQLVLDARRGDDERAAALFERALGLWQGTPFADLDTPWLNAQRGLIEDERLAAELVHNEVQLRRGRHADLLAGLSARAASHPLDEHVIEQLMLALYRSGRPVDALDQFQRLRRRLADESGTDPRPELWELQQRILNSDPALSWSGSSTASIVAPPVLVPQQLPAPSPAFTGRVTELAMLSSLLTTATDDRQRMPVAVVSGVGGLGKSRLVLHWAHQHVERFPDGQLFVDLRGFDPTADPMPATAALRGFLNALGVPPAAVPAEPAALTALYRSQIAGRRMLVVLDNARSTEQVTPLLPGSPSCTVVVTSRHKLTGLVTRYGARLVVPGMLDPVEAHQLLADALGKDRVTAEPAAVAEMVTYCAGLPLALAILAARAATHPQLPLATLAEELANTAGRLDALDGGELTANLSTVFASSYRALEPSAAHLFTLLGLVHGSDLSRPAAASLAALSPGRTRLLLRQLEVAHLVHQYVPDRYRTHDLIRLYAARQAEQELPAAERAAAIRRLVDFYLHTGAAADRRLAEHRAPVALDPPEPDCQPQTIADQPAAIEWFATEHACLVAAQELAAARQLLARVWQLAWVASTFHGWQGRIYDDLTMWQAGYAAAGQQADPAARALANRFLGRALGRTGRHAEALRHLRTAVTLLTQIGDRFGVAHTHRTLASNLTQQGDQHAALAHAEKALELYRELDAQAWIADALDLVGWQQAQLGDLDHARTNSEQALAMHREHGNREGEANALHSLGFIAHHAGRLAAALDCYHEALAVCRELGDAMQEANTLAYVGDVHASANEPALAREAWLAALAMHRSQRRMTEVRRTERKLADLDANESA